MTRFVAYEEEEYGMFCRTLLVPNLMEFLFLPPSESVSARSTTILRKGARRMLYTYPAHDSGTGIHHYYHSLPMAEGIIARKCVILTRTGVLDALSASRQ